MLQSLEQVLTQINALNRSLEGIIEVGEHLPELFTLLLIANVGRSETSSLRLRSSGHNLRQCSEANRRQKTIKTLDSTGMTKTTRVNNAEATSPRIILNLESNIHDPIQYLKHQSNGATYQQILWLSEQHTTAFDPP